MQRVLNLYKPVGVTPLQLILNFQKHNPEYATAKLGYAGRLDPMADGVLIILVNEKNKKRKAFESLQKTYTFDCLLGITTDTGDILGIITSSSTVTDEKMLEKLPQALTTIQRQKFQQYPVYSSRTVDGKPLYYYARKNLLNEITIPSHPITIHSLTLQQTSSIPADILLKNITSKIQEVDGDFRQIEILQNWKQYVATHQNSHTIVTCHISCSSGTYIRAICEEIGKSIGIDALALRITRESVGNYMLKDSLRVQ